MSINREIILITKKGLEFLHVQSFLMSSGWLHVKPWISNLFRLNRYLIILIHLLTRLLIHERVFPNEIQVVDFPSQGQVVDILTKYFSPNTFERL